MRIFRGTLLAGFLLAVSLLARVVVLQAQVSPGAGGSTGAPASRTSTGGGGNSNIGPHEAGNSPAITDRVSGLPVVVIVRPGENWAGKIGAWSSASPLVVRVTDITVNTTVAQAQSMGAQAASLPAGTIVVFGNELNNLDHEWKSRSAPQVGTSECSHGVTNGEVSGAARQYATLFAAFRAAAGGNVRVAPAPADMHNACYSGSVWMQAASASGVYNSATALVANAYETPEVGRTAAQDISEVEAIAGKPVTFLTEFGPHPALSVREHLDFLNSTNPPNGLKAATLVPNRCGQPVGSGTSNAQALPPTDMWLYYVNGELYNKGGQVIEVGEGNECDSSLSFPPPLVIPEPNVTEWENYLSNSQVYCAPKQSFQPVLEGQSPTLRICIEHSNVGEQKNSLGGFPVANRIIMGDQQCTGEEYPLIEGTETWDTTMLSFPLLRNDTGGISIEADLSRVNPEDTFAEAAKRNARPDYAPQFYLTSPEMQCQNAVNHLSYVEKICSNYSQSEGSSGCALDSEVVFPDGTTTRLLALRSELPNEAVCATIAEDMADVTNIRGLAVRAISTQTPKQFKLGFFVEHTYLHEPRGWPLGLFDSIGIKKIATWFGDGTPDINQAPGETVDYIPIWYNAGLALSAYDEYLDEAGDIRAYNYDPASLPEKTDPATLEPNENNFISGWNQTYAAILPMHIQQKINAEIRDTVKENWNLLREKANSVGANADQEGVIIECVDKQCLCYGDSTVEEIATLGVGNEYVVSTAANCGALPMAAIAASFPQSFQVPSREFMYDMKRLIIGRVNAGVQKSVPFDPTKTAPTDYRGPLTERSFEKCPVEPEDYGVQETANGIISSAYQQMGATGTPEQIAEYEQTQQTGPFAGPREAITQIVHEFMAKINPVGEDIMSEPDGSPKQSSRAYLILPDEAMTIEKTQSYVAPLFFSPEMYASIMSGKNPIYPFNGVPGAAVSAQQSQNQQELSAFLRTQGVTYDANSDDQGYGVYQATIGYHNTSRNCSTSDTPTVPGAPPEAPTCTCTVDPTPVRTATGYLRREVQGNITEDDVAIGGSEVWIAYGDYAANVTPTCANPVSITVTEVKKSLVGLEKRDAENPNPQTPGQLAALNEFMRRMAFLPLHMVQQYTGLEEFYFGGNTPVAPAQSGGGASQTGSACDPNFLRPVFGELADKVACLAQTESNSCTSTVNTTCLNDGSNGLPRGTWDYSYGPFQINLLAHPAYSDIVPPKLRQMWQASGVPEQVWSCSHAFDDPYDTGSQPDSDLNGTIGRAENGRMVTACRPGQKDWQVKMRQDCVAFFSNDANSRDYVKMLVERDNGSWAPWTTSAGICQLPRN